MDLTLVLFWLGDQLSQIFVSTTRISSLPWIHHWEDATEDPTRMSQVRGSFATHRIHVWYIFTYIYHKKQPNVGKYTIDGSWFFQLKVSKSDIWYMQHVCFQMPFIPTTRQHQATPGYPKIKSPTFAPLRFWTSSYSLWPSSTASSSPPLPPCWTNPRQKLKLWEVVEVVLMMSGIQFGNPFCNN